MPNTVQPGAKDGEARKLLASQMGRAEFSDLSIKCGREKWHVHRVIVAYHSNILAQPFGNSCALDGHPPEAVDAMIKYMYKFDYDHQDTESTLTAISHHLYVLDLAIRYNVSELVKHATSKFEEQMSAGASSESFAELTRELYRSECRWSSKVRDIASRSPANMQQGCIRRSADLDSGRL